MIKELEDYSWFPKIFRRYQADYIGSMVKWMSAYRPLVAELDGLVASTHPQFIHDLCSGSGLPARYMQDHVKNIPHSLLSDKYPDHSFKDDAKLTYIKTSTDALALIAQPGVFYTMYNAFHHFCCEEQKELLKRMAAGKNGFLFAEVLQPGILTMIRIIFAATILQVIAAPFVRPFSLKRLFFTYIVPVNLLTVLYDGIISVLRSRSCNYYRRLVEGLSDNSFEISVGQCHTWKRSLIFIKGNPVNS